jgi:adenosine/AMP kinase
MELKTVRIEKPDDLNFILGQSHFIKTVEDIHEALVTAVPGIKFGVAFCESSGAALVRASGNDTALVEMAKKNALALSAGHSFIVILGAGFFPINVLHAIKDVPEVRQHLLRDGKSSRGSHCGDGAGAWDSRSDRRRQDEGHRR